MLPLNTDTNQSKPILTYRDFTEGKLAPIDAFSFAADALEKRGYTFHSLVDGGYVRGLNHVIQRVVTSSEAADMHALQDLIGLGKIYMRREDMAGEEIDWFTCMFMTTNGIRSMVKASSVNFNAVHAGEVIDMLLHKTSLAATFERKSPLNAKDIELLMMRVGVQQMNTPEFPEKKGLLSAIIERLSRFAGIDDAGIQDIFNALLYNNAKSYRDFIVRAILDTEIYDFFDPNNGFKAYMDDRGLIGIDEERYRELSDMAFRGNVEAKAGDKLSETIDSPPVEYMI